MATLMRQYMFDALDTLRYEPTPKAVRVLLRGQVVAYTENAMLVWEPRRVVPSYAIPIADLSVALEDVEPAVDGDMPAGLLDPSDPFSGHTSAGRSAVVRAQTCTGAGFLPDALEGLIVLNFADFDWFEEEDEIFGHPRDPFSRIDIRHSKRRVEVEVADVRLAESENPLMLFETYLPSRFYLATNDVLAHLVRSDTETTCAYKGQATHWSAPDLGPEGTDIAWSYLSPPPEMSQITGRICFYQERVDLTVDGVRLQRPITPWSD